MTLGDEQIAEAAARWAGLTIEPDTVRAYAARCAPEGVRDDGLAELVLAAGCSAGDPVALAHFDAAYLDAVPAALAHMRLGPERVDEIRQLVRHKLLVAEPGEPPTIDRYAGRGRLRGLVQVVAARSAVSLLRKDRGQVGDAPLGRIADPGHDPELRYMKERYRASFRDAFERAVRSLTSRERNLLRLQIDGGLTVEQLGEVYGVHRATATRWLTKIREQLLRDTRRQLADELGASAEELDSLMELVQSRLDVSVRRMLETVTPDEGPDAPASDPGA